MRDLNHHDPQIPNAPLDKLALNYMDLFVTEEVEVG